MAFSVFHFWPWAVIFLWPYLWSLLDGKGYRFRMYWTLRSFCSKFFVNGFNDSGAIIGTLWGFYNSKNFSSVFIQLFFRFNFYLHLGPVFLVNENSLFQDLSCCFFVVNSFVTTTWSLLMQLLDWIAFDTNVMLLSHLLEGVLYDPRIGLYWCCVFYGIFSHFSVTLIFQNGINSSAQWTFKFQ